MGSSTDIRWIQRLSQYNKALKTLSEAYALNEKIFECLYYNVVSESMLIAKER